MGREPPMEPGQPAKHGPKSETGHNQPLRIYPDSGHPSHLPGVRFIGVVIRTQRRPLPCHTVISGSIMTA